MSRGARATRFVIRAVDNVVESISGLMRNSYVEIAGKRRRKLVRVRVAWDCSMVFW